MMNKNKKWDSKVQTPNPKPLILCIKKSYRNPFGPVSDLDRLLQVFSSRIHKSIDYLYFVVALVCVRVCVHVFEVLLIMSRVFVSVSSSSSSHLVSSSSKGIKSSFRPLWRREAQRQRPFVKVKDRRAARDGPWACSCSSPASATSVNITHDSASSSPSKKILKAPTSKLERRRRKANPPPRPTPPPPSQAKNDASTSAGLLVATPVVLTALVTPAPAHAKTASETVKAVVDAVDINSLLAMTGPTDFVGYLLTHPAPALAFSVLLYFGIPALTRIAVKYVVVPAVVLGTIVLVLADPSASGDFVSNVTSWCFDHPRVLSISALVVAGLAISPYIIAAAVLAAIVAFLSGVAPLFDGGDDAKLPLPLELVLPQQAKQEAKQAARTVRQAEDKVASVRGKAKERIDRIEEGVRTKVPQKSSWVPSTVPDESL